MRQSLKGHSRIAAIAELRHSLARREYAESMAKEIRATETISKLSNLASEIRNLDKSCTGESLAMYLGYANRMLMAGAIQQGELKKISAHVRSKRNLLRNAEGVSKLANARLQDTKKIYEQKEMERYSFSMKRLSKAQIYGSAKR